MNQNKINATKRFFLKLDGTPRSDADPLKNKNDYRHDFLS